MSEDEERKPDVVLKVPTLVYSRIVGYITPTTLWNRGKRKEFEDRVTFDVKELLERPK